MSLTLGPWVLEERLARGGMAEVWRGHKVGKAEPVCIKRLDPGLTQDPDFVEMFRDEARLVLQLDHSNVVKTFALYDDKPGGQPGELLLIMELVDGPSLARLTKALSTQAQAPPTPREALTIASQLGRALQHVHTRNDDDGTQLSIVHRDVSPQNLLLDRSGRLVLIDFGVARAASRLTHTRAGTLKGKAAYMAPEQVQGKRVDGGVDQFAAAVVVWELLCHRALFHGTNELRILEQIERADVVPPSVVAGVDAFGKVTKDIDALVMKALAFDRGARFVDMAAFSDAVDVILERLGGPADLVPLVQRGLAAIEISGRASEQPTRTRVLQTDPARKTAVVDVVAEDLPRRQQSMGPLVAGAVIVAAVVIGAVAVARGGGDDGAVVVNDAVVIDLDTDVARVDVLEQQLQRAPSHPCRTELLDELLDRATLNGIVDDIAKDVATCVAVADAAPALRDALEKKHLLQIPPEVSAKKGNAKKKPSAAKLEKAEAKRLDEMSRRAKLALDAAATDVAKALLEAVVSDDPARTDDRRLLAEAYRRAGDVALAGVEVRAVLTARPFDPERPRLLRWLKRNDLPLP